MSPSPTSSRIDPAAVRAARANRVRMIRRRVVGGSVALFIAVWSLIAVRLVAGHDPALSRVAAVRTIARSSTATATPTTTTATPATTTSQTATAAQTATATPTTTTATPATSSATSGSASSGVSPVTSSAS